MKQDPLYQSVLMGVKSLIAKVLKQPEMAESLSDDTDLLNDIGLDSLQIIAFMLSTEEAFDCEFDYDQFDYTQLSSINAFAQYVLRQMNHSYSSEEV